MSSKISRAEAIRIAKANHARIEAGLAIEVEREEIIMIGTCKERVDEWLNSLVTRCDNGEKTTILKYLAELFVVNDFSFNQHGYGTQALGGNVYGRDGLTYDEAKIMSAMLDFAKGMAWLYPEAKDIIVDAVKTSTAE